MFFDFMLLHQFIRVKNLCFILRCSTRVFVVLVMLQLFILLHTAFECHHYIFKHYNSFSINVQHSALLHIVPNV